MSDRGPDSVILNGKKVEWIQTQYVCPYFVNPNGPIPYHLHAHALLPGLIIAPLKKYINVKKNISPVYA